jgi:hypothetical protein
MAGSIRTHLPHPGGLRRRSRWWPSIAARQEEAFRNIWQALRQHDQVRSGLPSLHARHERAESYAILALRIPAEVDLGASIAPIRQLLEQMPFVRLLPANTLHISIQELGLIVDAPKRPDETSRALIDEFIRHATMPMCDFPRFAVEIGGFNSFLDTPFLDVYDDGWCYRVHHRLRDFLLLHLADDYAYLPHVVLGHYTQNAPMGSLPAVMAPWRDRRFGEFLADSLDILEFSTSDPFAAPTVLHSFELGHQRGAADAIREGGPTEII